MTLQIVHVYEVTWERPNGNVQRLEVLADDLQAVLRSVLRTEPRSRIGIEQLPSPQLPDVDVLTNTDFGV